jgi:peptide/nickel transport system substrate-binding protein
MVLTIKLNQKAMWSDGVPVTAHDYVFEYEMTMDDGNIGVASRYPYDPYVDSFVALDDYTIQICLNDVYVAWAVGFNLFPLPKHILGPIYEAEGSIDDAEWNWNPTVGTGPFILTEWASASHLAFEANPNYWRGAPKLDKLFIRIVPDDEAQMAALETGDADIGVYLTADDKPVIDAMGNIELVQNPSGWVESWFFNLISEELGEANGLQPGHIALQDKRVRQAIAMGMNRQLIIDELFFGLYEIPGTLWYDSPYANPDIEPWPYDPEAAKALLDEAGWIDSNGDGTRDKDGVELVIQYSTTAGNENREATGVLAQQMLSEIGIGVEILNYSYDVIWNSFGDGGPVALGQYDIAEWSMAPWDAPDPNTGDWLCDEIPSDEYPAGGNWQGVCIEELDELFTEQVVTLDDQARIQMFHRIGEIMHDELFWMPMRKDPDFWALNKRLQNVNFSGASISGFYNTEEWDTTDDTKSATISFFEEPDNLNQLYTGMWFSQLTTVFWLDSLWTWDDQKIMFPLLAAELPTIENGGIYLSGE